MNRERGFQQFTGGVQKRRGIVIAARHNRHFARSLLQTPQKIVIKTHRRIGRRGCIEHIPGNDQNVDPPIRDRFQQPVEKCGELPVAPAVMELMPDMPV